MKTFLLILCVFFAGVMHARAQSIPTVTDSTTANRPTDLLTQDIRWNRVSTDFFTYRIDAGDFGFYGPQPSVLIDGLPIDANFFGWQDLNMLPIAETKRVKFSFQSQVYHGVLSPGGVMDFQRSRPDTGFSVAASFYAGNETGDPGPYNYDSTKVTPNIDRWGPDGTLALGYCSRHWYAQGNFVYRNSHPTDLALNARLHFTASLLGTNEQYVNHIIHEKTSAGLLEAGYNRDDWEFKVRAAKGTAEDYLFLQPFGREIPAKTGYQQIALQGAYHVGSWAFSGRYIDHQKTIDKRYDLHSYIFDWDQRRHTINFASTYSTPKIKFHPGLSYQRRHTIAPGLDDVYNDLVNFSLDGSLQPTVNDSLGVQFNIDYDENKTAGGWGAVYRHRLTSAWSITPSITHTEVLPLRQQSFSYWVNRGYTFADKLGITFNGVTVAKDKLTSAQLTNRVQLSSHTALELEQKFIRHTTLNVPYQKVKAKEFITDTQPGRFTVTQETGSRLRLYALLSNQPLHIFKQSFVINYQRTVTGSDRYKAYFRQIPDLKLQYRAAIKPTRDLNLSATVAYRSATRWSEFNAIEGNRYRLPSGVPIRDVSGIFHTRTPAYTNLSAGINKWFLDRRISLMVSINNLLDQQIRMHPLGANLSTKFDLKVRLKL